MLRQLAAISCAFSFNVAHIAAICKHGPSPIHRRTFAPLKHMYPVLRRAGHVPVAVMPSATDLEPSKATTCTAQGTVRKSRATSRDKSVFIPAPPPAVSTLDTVGPLVKATRPKTQARKIKVKCQADLAATTGSELAVRIGKRRRG